MSYSVDELKWRRDRLLVWDVGGQDKLRTLWRHFYGEVGCLVFVLDSGDRQRFVEARDELRQLLAAPQLVKVPLLVLANKQDLNYAVPIADIADILQLSSLDISYGPRPVRLMPASAWKGTGLTAAMDWIGEQCAARGAHRFSQTQPHPSDANNHRMDFELPLAVLSHRCQQHHRRSNSGRRAQHRRGSSE